MISNWAQQESNVKKIVLLTGSGGFVGKAVQRCATASAELLVKPIVRNDAAAQILNAPRSNPGAQISVLNLAWPSMQQYSASSSEPGRDDVAWGNYTTWLSSLIDAAAQAKVRFFQIGSGIEPYALGKAQIIGEPYRTYACRKNEIWRQVEKALPDASWRLRLHFLFGPDEAAQRFIPAAIRAFKTGGSLTIGAPERKRCWLHVDDAARGLLAAVAAEAPESWDICGGRPVSFADLLGLIGEVTGGAAHFVPSALDIADAACLVAEPTKLAPFMPDGVGELDNLRKRLKGYAQGLAD